MEFLKHNVDYVIISILGLMSFVVVWLTIERLIFYANVKFENYKNQDDFEESMTRNLTTLYIIYSNAPYVGLLGTVAGIMVTFYDMGMSGGIDTKIDGGDDDFSLAFYVFTNSFVVALFFFDVLTRLEERRVGKECRSRWSPYP